MLNFANSPSFWETTGYLFLGVIIMLLTMLPLVGWVVVLGCGYLTYNYLHNIQDWNIVLSIILGIIVSSIMGALLSGGGQENQKHQFY
ncbi:hypothetical protein [Lutibacter sp.]|uniref:hypothetical protein n=1 Tax=Lutibacter sp. TaxID=1925666 RepID=UPI001A3353C9|nr:hypothetical protein [Lutibacter sp.]MBI9042819.1 hypothetical protein [Lutibacter sp.]